MTKRRRTPAPILNQSSFVWLKSETHSDPQLFRERQRERIARMQANATEAAVKVAPIKPKVAA